MLQKFRKFITENGLVKPGDKILLAVSGGIDSMVMTHLFLQSGVKPGIAHCNFLLREAESDKDEALVSGFAAEHNLAFYSARFETKTYARENGVSIQMAARELRYKWFEETREKNGYLSVAVAHNMNDNIETLLINLIRGTGIAGLTGMKLSVNNIIRPMLFATRSDIITYCADNKIMFREDRSNADTKYLRNKIRHNIIPLLKEINPSVESTLNETAERLAGINEIVSEYIGSLRENVSNQENDYITFNITSLNPYLHNRSILFELFRPYGINDVPINDLLNVIKGKSGGQLLTGTHRIIKNRNEIMVLGGQTADNDYNVIKSINDLYQIKGITSCSSVTISEDFKIPTAKGSACIDFDKLTFPLIIRKWNAGDHFFPLGMNLKKKLSDFFIDNKYSIHDKDTALIMESDGKIVLIIGDRLDNRFRITKQSKNALIINAIEKSTPED